MCAPTTLLERGVGLPLLVEVLDDRLDDQIAVLQRVERRRARQVAERRVARLRRSTLPLATPSSRNFLMRPRPLSQQRLVHLADDRLVAGGRAHLRDARAHQAAAEHADGLDRIILGLQSALWHRPRSLIARARVPTTGLSHDRGDALAAADAGGRQAALLAAAPQLEQQRQQQPRAAHAERMAERDRAAVDVDLVAIEPELLLDREILAGERLVDLDQIDVVERQAGARQRLARRRRRTHAHQRRLDADRGPVDETAERLQAVAIDRLARRQNQRRAAVDDAARVAGGHRAVLLERRRQLREHLHRRLGPQVIVAVDDLRRPCAS